VPEFYPQAKNFESYGNFFKLRLLPWTWLTGWWNEREDINQLKACLEDTHTSGFSFQIKNWRFEVILRRRA
jgi:hypothetical protein